MSVVSPAILGRVVSEARATMLDLEPLDVPATLHKVAVQTGKKLPPPMARRLIDELDMNEWLRGKVAERLAGSVDSDDRDEVAAVLFLERPEGWDDRLREIESAAAGARQDDANDQLRLRVSALEHELDAARNRAKRAQREAEMSRAEAEKRVTSARSASRSGRDIDHQALEVARRENAGMAQRLAEMARDLEEHRTRLKQIRSELLKERRTERPVDLPPPQSVWADLDPRGAARLLDEVSIALAPAGEFVEVELPFERDPMVLPSGVAPDERAAVDWLVSYPESYVLVIDGYNVSFLQNPDQFNTADGRRRLNNELARFRRLAAAKPRVIVVYDSDQSGGISSESAPGGVEVVFTTVGHSADDEVLVMATELGGSAVVISTDRRVREGAERVGALGLWSQALVDWSG